MPLFLAFGITPFIKKNFTFERVKASGFIETID
jgi:hypothetical protein